MSGAFSKALVQGERDGVVTKVLNPEVVKQLPKSPNQPQVAEADSGYRGGMYRSASGNRASYRSRRRAQLLGVGTELES